MHGKDYTVIPEIFDGINIFAYKIFDTSNFRHFYNGRKIYYATTYSITLVRAVATRNASLSMEKPASISQLLPLPTACWHP